MSRNIELFPGLRTLEHFIGPAQMAALVEACRGEEGQAFRAKVQEYATRVKQMPDTYQTTADGGALAYLHYFTAGSDWWIVEKDAGAPDDEPSERGKQVQAYGYALLNGDRQNAESGYISIQELIENGAELDLYWTPKPLGDVRAELRAYDR